MPSFYMYKFVTVVKAFGRATLTIPWHHKWWQLCLPSTTNFGGFHGTKVGAVDHFGAEIWKFRPNEVNTKAANADIDNERDCVLNHRRLDCLPNGLFRHRSKKTSMLHIIGLCKGNPPVIVGFPSQSASNAAENVSIWWRHYIIKCGIIMATTMQN